MKPIKTALRGGLAALFVLAVSLPAGAASITFTNWSMSGSDTVIPVFTVSDDPAGKFQVDISIAPSSPNQFGEITGVYFDLGDDVIVEADITGESAAGALQAHTDFATNASSIGGVTNLNLGDFEVVLGYKDGNARAVPPMQFFVDDKAGALALSDWTKVGLRFQSVGEFDFGGGSDKEVSMMSSSVVPVPAAVWLFGSALLGLAGAARRRGMA